MNCCSLLRVGGECHEWLLMSALQSTCSGWCSKWKGVSNGSWIFIVWTITATWLLPDMHVGCIYSVHVVQCCFETPPTWDIIKLLYYDSPSPPHHTHHTCIHTSTPHPPPPFPPPDQSCASAHQCQEHRVEQIKQAMVSSSNMLLWALFGGTLQLSVTVCG